MMTIKIIISLAKKGSVILAIIIALIIIYYANDYVRNCFLPANP